MYESHFGFTERPFSVLPDPRFLYFGPNHKRAFSMLEYGVMQRDGFTVITGDVGAGKTTLIRHLLGRLPQEASIGLITSTPRHESELLPRIMLSFQQPFEEVSGIALYKRFQEFLVACYAEGGSAILIVDEAQNLGADRLEELRMLSNINAEMDQLLQLVIVGQPQLRDILRRPDMVQFRQRVSAHYHIGPLDQAETHAYIEHRLRVAGGDPATFSGLTRQLIYRASRGVPRVINALCDACLVYGFAEEVKEISPKIFHEVLDDKRRQGIFDVDEIRAVLPILTQTAEKS